MRKHRHLNAKKNGPKRADRHTTMASRKKSILPKKPEDLYKISTKGWNEEVYSKVRFLQVGGLKTTGRGNVALVLDEAEIRKYCSETVHFDREDVVNFCIFNC
jgi:hypothetical protein